MSGDATRIPAIIRPAVGGAAIKATTSELQPIRHEQFTSQAVSTPDLLSAILTRLNNTLSEVTRVLRSNPLARPHIYEDIVVGVAGAKTKIQHNFGRRVFFSVVRWSGNATILAPVLVSDEFDGATALTDKNTLYLRSYAVGTASIAIY